MLSDQQGELVNIGRCKGWDSQGQSTPRQVLTSGLKEGELSHYRVAARVGEGVCAAGDPGPSGSAELGSDLQHLVDRPRLGGGGCRRLALTRIPVAQLRYRPAAGAGQRGLVVKAVGGLRRRSSASTR